MCIIGKASFLGSLSAPNVYVYVSSDGCNRGQVDVCVAYRVAAAAEILQTTFREYQFQLISALVPGAGAYTSSIVLVECQWLTRSVSPYCRTCTQLWTRGRVSGARSTVRGNASHNFSWSMTACSLGGPA